MQLSVTEENYLKGIYNLQEKSDKANTNSLAAHMNNTAASVSDMLRKLKTKKLIEYTKYHGFKLNAAGSREALKVIRRHRLWEYFLVSKLGMDWHKIHDIAEQLEHITDQELIDRLDDFLGNPRMDPHGDPIPDRDGVMTQINQSPLTELSLKKLATISSVGDQSQEMMELLNHYGIKIGSQIKVLKSFDFDGSLQVKIGRDPECIISGMAAQSIFVYDN